MVYGFLPVSYTHLDVYKRQFLYLPGGVGFFLRFQAAGQLFGLHPGHAGIRPLAGNQRLDGRCV